MSGLGPGVGVYGAEPKFRIPKRVVISEPFPPNVIRTGSNTLSKAGRESALGHIELKGKK